MTAVAAILAIALTTAAMTFPVSLAACCWLYDRHRTNRRKVSGTPLTDRGYNSGQRFDDLFAEIRNLPESGGR